MDYCMERVGNGIAEMWWSSLIMLNHKESWVLKNWCFWTVVSEKTLESPLDFKEIQPVHPKGNQSWVFIGRTDVEAPILWLHDVKNWLIGKDPDGWERLKAAGENGTTEDEMVGWHHWLDGHEFEQAPWVGDGQGSLACCSPRGHKESDTTEQLNLTDVLLYLIYLCICFYLMILFLNLFTYLAALGLSCGTQEL